jgi:phosphohistidine phosphatase SixA
MLVAERASAVRNVMIIGHNPSLVVALNHMVGERHTDRNLSYFPTSCVADVGFPADRLGEIEPDEGTLLSMMRVRDLAL